MVFCSGESLPRVKAVTAKVAYVKNIFIIGESDEYGTLRGLVNDGKERDFPEDVAVDQKEDVAFILYSSGTTGKPKAVMLTHYNIVALTVVVENNCSIGAEARAYFDRPMFHVSSIITLVMCMHDGHQLILAGRCPVGKMLETIQDYKVTQIGLTPPVLLRLLHTPLRDKYDTSSLEELHCFASAAGPSLFSETERLYGVRVLQGYGMTEAGVIAHTVRDKLSPSSVGFMLSNSMAKIKDLHTGKPVGPNVNGEICLKGPQVMKGYYKNPGASAQSFDEDGWFLTGDMGYYDEAGLLYVIGRFKDVIRVSPTSLVHPAEIEIALLEHPKIADVGVIGVPSPDAELPMAIVVKSDQSLTENDVIGYVKEKLPDDKQLRAGVLFTEVIPKSITGKILRKELKAIAGTKTA